MLYCGVVSQTRPDWMDFLNVQDVTREADASLL